MEHVLALIVLTLLQQCRAQTTSTEWFAANLVNDPSYTPRPITEIFTTDLTFIPKNPTVSTQAPFSATPPTTISTTMSPLPSTVASENPPQQIQQSTPQIINMNSRPPQLFPQQPPANGIPSVILYYDPNQQTSQVFQRPSVTPIPISPVTQTIMNEVISTVALPNMPTSTLQPPITWVQSSTQGPTLVPGNQPAPNLPQALPGAVANCNSTVPISPNQQGMSPERKPIITVRVKHIKGSVTNIRINPSTTTKRPITTRRRKSNKRTRDYDACVNSCNGRKDPICSSPMGIFPVDPDRLKGFASLCHMACHNSFRMDQVYEKVADGRCGRLRTRIRPLDKNKLNREDLNKAQYTIVHDGPETVMEFSPLSR